MTAYDDARTLVQQVYITYYGRPADPIGMDYWALRVAGSGASLAEVIDAFGSSQEYTDRFAELTARELVNNLYLQLLGRSADPEGLAFYTKLLAENATTLPQLALDVLAGVTTSGADARTLAHKTQVATAYTDAVSANKLIYEAQQATELLATVTDDVATRDEALRTIAISSGTLLTSSLSGSDSLFETAESTARFLNTATFGAQSTEIVQLTGSSASAWFVQELSRPAASVLSDVQDFTSNVARDESSDLFRAANTINFWKSAIESPAQLRQRMAYALSQIFVVSDLEDQLRRHPPAIARFRDMLLEHAFGNYRDLLEAVTFSPAMGWYLTYLGSRKADSETGSLPDQNYAREIMQLFSIGLHELNIDGSIKVDPSGSAISTYGSDDVSGLSRVFTGFGLDADWELFETDPFLAKNEGASLPMVLRLRHHSQREKHFLSTQVAAGTNAEESLRLALDQIAAHPNVGPFIGRQLIQRFTTSDPSPAYVAEVATAFDSGFYTLPDDSIVGTGTRGDLSAALAAVLFGAAEHRLADTSEQVFGKVREPILRFTQWARAFDVDASHPEYRPALYATERSHALSQHPFRSPSVFNFYRPGYVPPGTASGDAGMTVPEMQIVNASSIPGYANFMSRFVFAEGQEARLAEVWADFVELGIPFNRTRASASFLPDYTQEIAMADDPDALVGHLNVLLAHGDLEESTRVAIRDAIEEIPLTPGSPQGAELRVAYAVFMVMTAPEYLVQR